MDIYNQEHSLTNLSPKPRKGKAKVVETEDLTNLSPKPRKGKAKVVETEGD